MRYEDIDPGDIANYWKHSWMWDRELDQPVAMIDQNSDSVVLMSVRDKSKYSISNSKFLDEYPIDKYIPPLGYRLIRRYCVYYSARASRGMAKGLIKNRLSRSFPSHLCAPENYDRIADSYIHEALWNPKFYGFDKAVRLIGLGKYAGLPLNNEFALFLTNEDSKEITIGYKDNTVGTYNVSTKEINLFDRFSYIRPALSIIKDK